MASGTPLSDLDRAGWVEALCKASQNATEPTAILACSALTVFVQEPLRTKAGRDVRWLLLSVPRKILQDRLNTRKNHFMPASQLDNQLATLTPPKDAIHLNAATSPETLVAAALSALNERA